MGRPDGISTYFKELAITASVVAMLPAILLTSLKFNEERIHNAAKFFRDTTTISVVHVIKLAVVSAMTAPLTANSMPSEDQPEAQKMFVAFAIYLTVSSTMGYERFTENPMGYLLSAVVTLFTSLPQVLTCQDLLSIGMPTPKLAKSAAWFVAMLALMGVCGLVFTLSHEVAGGIRVFHMVNCWGLTFKLIGVLYLLIWWWLLIVQLAGASASSPAIRCCCVCLAVSTICELSMFFSMSFFVQRAHILGNAENAHDVPPPGNMQEGDPNADEAAPPPAQRLTEIELAHQA